MALSMVRLITGPLSLLATAWRYHVELSHGYDMARSQDLEPQIFHAMVIHGRCHHSSFLDHLELSRSPAFLGIYGGSSWSFRRAPAFLAAPPWWPLIDTPKDRGKSTLVPPEDFRNGRNLNGWAMVWSHAWREQWWNPGLLQANSHGLVAILHFHIANPR